MIAHQGDCEGRPCINGEHRYLCAACGELFITTPDTRHLAPGGRLPSPYWPACSSHCYTFLFSAKDPNGLLGTEHVDPDYDYGEDREITEEIYNSLERTP